MFYEFPVIPLLCFLIQKWKLHSRRRREAPKMSPGCNCPPGKQPCQYVRSVLPRWAPTKGHAVCMTRTTACHSNMTIQPLIHPRIYLLIHPSVHYAFFSSTYLLFIHSFIHKFSSGPDSLSQVVRKSVKEMRHNPVWKPQCAVQSRRSLSRQGPSSSLRFWVSKQKHKNVSFPNE